MRLYVPGAREAVQVSGIVRAHSEGDEPGFWADFVDATEAAQKHICEVLSRRERASAAVPIGRVAVQPDDDPRRAFPRLNARFAVRFANVQDFVLEYAANISAGGIFVTTEPPPPLKSVVQVEMELPGGDGPVPAHGIVVHRVTREEARRRGTQPGVGVQFVDADDEFRRRIDAAIAHILEANRAA
jgi:uncharacterized protein (TIGR02266 family)